MLTSADLRGTELLLYVLQKISMYSGRAPPRRDIRHGRSASSSKAASHMTLPLELPSPSPVQESDDASIDESSLSPEDEDDTENEEEHEMDSSLRPTSFCLNGKRWSFENPVSLVLAAARQLGMAVQRDARLLWIADEALLDEYDEDQVAWLLVKGRAAG